MREGNLRPRVPTELVVGNQFFMWIVLAILFSIYLTNVRKVSYLLSISVKFPKILDTKLAYIPITMYFFHINLYFRNEDI